MYHADRSVVQVGIVGHNALELVLAIRSKETTQLLIPSAFLLLFSAFLVLGKHYDHDQFRMVK